MCYDRRFSGTSHSASDSRCWSTGSGFLSLSIHRFDLPLASSPPSFSSWPLLFIFCAGAPTSSGASARRAEFSPLDPQPISGWMWTNPGQHRTADPADLRFYPGVVRAGLPDGRQRPVSRQGSRKVGILRVLPGRNADQQSGCCRFGSAGGHDHPPALVAEIPHPTRHLRDHEVSRR